jgi:hypothetical protein
VPDIPPIPAAFPGQRGFVGGSMGDDAALYSTVHGAGRPFGRKEAKRHFTRAEMDACLGERGVVLIGADLDESPMAYRRLPEVIAEHAGTIKVRHTLRPFAVAMVGAGEFDPFRIDAAAGCRRRQTGITEKAARAFLISGRSCVGHVLRQRHVDAGFR